MRPKRGVRGSKGFVVSFVAVVVLAVSASTGVVSARSPGNCYCFDSIPPYASYKDAVSYPESSGVGSNTYQTSPYDQSSTGEVGADQYSLADSGSGFIGSANYEMVTALGWESDKWTTGFESGDPVTFVFYWSINWIAVNSDDTDPGDCGGATGAAAEVALSAAVYDDTTSAYVLGSPWTEAVSEEIEGQSPFSPTSYSQWHNITWSAASGLNSNDEYSTIALVILETQAEIDLSCGVMQQYVNVDSATLTEFDWYSS